MKTKSLKRLEFDKAREPEGRGPRRGRALLVPVEVRLKLRNCYVGHYKQWGPRTLALWARREGLGDYSPSTISAIIADLKEKVPPPERPRRYEITASNVMWSEDGAGFREHGAKKELLLAQDECSRYKVNHRLVKGPAQAEDVCSYLREAFDEHGAPLIVKHDGGPIFRDAKVQKLFDEYEVVGLTSPAHYPPFNGKMERAIRDIRSFERAMHRQGVTGDLQERITAAIHDLNDERPRPMLGGHTSRETYEGGKTTLPDRSSFRKMVQRMENLMMFQSCTRKERDDARRKAVELVLWRQGFIKESTDVSTHLKNQRVTK